MDKVISDRLNISDNKPRRIPMPDFPAEMKNNPTLWRKTEVLCSNGDVILNPKGKSSFAPDAPFTVSTNMVPWGGVQYVMEQLFGIKGSINIPTLYDVTDASNDGVTHYGTYEKPVGAPNSQNITIDDANCTYTTPRSYISGKNKNIVPYRMGHIVQLFGMGITGTAENDITVYPVNYREYCIDSTIASEDETMQPIQGTMVPFRYTNTQLTMTSERPKYFGKVMDSNGIISYYLKTFEDTPIIKHCWKLSEDDEYEETNVDDNLVSEEDFLINTRSLNNVESFTEIILKISKKDAKEWFAAIGQEDRARINTIALFSGRYVTNYEGAIDHDGDFEDVMLFSKLNIPVEYLTLSKDLNIIYRVYGA